ncbi:MAG: hypothetical protein QOE92_2296 [Chloroflexota bacterium]|jgi:lipoprotein-anchoring transpeptidase ErfK/SrfK|nr:hypothetical protein [Chloroflexota bacterium]
MATAIAVPENQADSAPGADFESASSLPWRLGFVRSALLAAIASVLIAGFLAQTRFDIDAANATAATRQRTMAVVDAERAAGVDEALLAPALERIHRLDGAAAPVRFLYIDPLVGFQDGQQAAYRDVATDLATLPATVITVRRAQVQASYIEIRQAAARWPGVGGDPAEIAPVLAGAQRLSADADGSTDLRLLAAIAGQSAKLQASITGSLAQQQADHDNQARYASEELAAATSDAAGAHLRADDLTHNGSGDGEVAVKYHVPGADVLLARINAHGAAAKSAGTPEALAGALAWLRVDQERLGAAMQASMPEKAIYVSLAREELRAYDHGKPFITTLVTTGRPELGTDTGEMSVIKKDSPWVMHSPWPRGSKYWYPDTRVTYVLWFHVDGSGLHDAPWRSRYGPGTNDANGTHGCVNIPYAETVKLFNWAPVGTPVYIY